jgi:membrane-bound lytic murein transglycosylase B
LFPLRDVEGISFGNALNYASAAASATGVRAALILAVLSQESDLGKNVGSCYVTDIATGDGIGKNSGKAFQKVMKAPRDTEPFKRIASTVGKAWGATPVSCPIGAVYSSSRGYGGAMGPSQFIPSTWELYENRLRSALKLGNTTPNPWDAGHAIMATALYLKDLGAAGGAYSAERNAACRYYSGRSCDTRTPTNYKYGNSVVAKAEAFQTNIDFLKGI